MDEQLTDSKRSNSTMKRLNSRNGGQTSEKSNTPESQRAVSPEPSCVSMKSDASMKKPPAFSSEPVTSDPKSNTSESQRAVSPEPSCVSMKSDTSMKKPPAFSSGPVTSDPKHHCTGAELQTHTLVEETGDPQTHTLMKGTGDLQQVDDVLHRVLDTHKTSMKNKFERLYEGIKMQENETLLNSIYTQLYIIEGESKGVNKEHEVLQMENTLRKPLQGTSLYCNNIFQPQPESKGIKKGQEKNIRSVLTKGIAGIGKTVSVQKFILDWAEGKANQDVNFIFVFPFRELNLFKDEQYSLHRFLCDFHPELRNLDPKVYDKCRVVLIFDGLDESKIPLDFSESEKLTDITMESSVGVLMSYLIKGELLPSALIWITSRPAAANQIPPQYIDRVTDIQGFNDTQKEEYFRKRIGDQHLATKVISHLKTARSLYIMCHIPVFCWISATVLLQIMKQSNHTEIPKTLTEMYTHFLCTQTNIKNKKYEEKDENDSQNLLQSNRPMILQLAKLAYKQLMKGNILFYEEDLRECGIDVTEASVHSGICTEIFRVESVLYQRKIYCFVHLSFQEFLAAFYVFFCYMILHDYKELDDLMPVWLKHGIFDWDEDFAAGSGEDSGEDSGEGSGEDSAEDLFEGYNCTDGDEHRPQGETLPLYELLMGSVDEALESQNGHLDLFLRFLLGISLESNQRLLEGLLTHTHNSSKSIEKTIEYIKEIIKEEKANNSTAVMSNERSISLFLCLIEMKDQSVSKEIQENLKSKERSEIWLSPAECSALVYMLLSSEEGLDELDQKKFNTSDEGYRRLIPAVSKCRKAILPGCYLTEDCIDAFCTALASVNSPLRELDLSNNPLQDSGIALLTEGLKSSHCKLEILRLAGCNLGEKTCEHMASALKLENSHLRQLDLSNNDLNNLGVEQLSAGLKSSHCKLETLRLAICNLGEQSCENLASALQQPNSLLRELDLSNNDLNNSGVEQLSAGLKSSHCTLEKLRLSGCLVTEEGCSSLASALSSNSSHLKELDLTYNHPGESGVKLLSARLEDPHCRLETLGVEHAGHIRIRPALRKYACEFTLDPNTAFCKFTFSEGNRRVKHTGQQQIDTGLDHPDRFDSYGQVLSVESVCGKTCSRCYWEAEWDGCGHSAQMTMTYKGIDRKGDRDDCRFGMNVKSWRLDLYNRSDGGDGRSNISYTVWHNRKETALPAPPSSSNRVGVYVDWPAGTLSFYSVSKDTHTLTHLHTFTSTFNEPLYAGICLYDYASVHVRDVCCLGMLESTG